MRVKLHDYYSHSIFHWLYSQISDFLFIYWIYIPYCVLFNKETWFIKMRFWFFSIVHTIIFAYATCPVNCVQVPRWPISWFLEFANMSRLFQLPRLVNFANCPSCPVYSGAPFIRDIGVGPKFGRNHHFWHNEMDMPIHFRFICFTQVFNKMFKYSKMCEYDTNDKKWILERV